MAREYKKTYINVSADSINKETGEVKFNSYVEDLGELNVTFKFKPQDEWKSGDGQYGPWTICGDINIDGFVDNKGLFAQYDWETKTKIQGRGGTLKKGCYYSIFENKGPDKEEFPYKFYVKNEVLPF